MTGATLEHATFKHATCHGHSLLNDNSTSLLPTPPNSPGVPPTLSSTKTLNRTSHYQTFTQARLLTPPNSAGLPLEHHSHKPSLKKLHRVSSHFQITKSIHSRSLNRPMSTMGFIGSKKDKEKSKEEKERSRGKGKEKERKDLSVDDHGDGNASSSKFSLNRTPSKKDKSLKKKRSVARLLLLAATGSPSTVLLPPSPKNRSHVDSVSTTESSSSYEEKPVPLVIPTIPDDDEYDENDGRYAYAVEHRDAHFATKYITKNRWHMRNNMKLHPYGSDAVYMQSYEHMSLNNDRHFNMLLRRINRNGSPSFHDYSKLGETPPSCALDLACGQGHWILQAATQWPNSKIVGLDLVDVTLPQVLENENITFVRGNFLHYALPFPTQSFDYVRIANASLAIPYEKWRFVLKEVQRVLTRGGRLEVIDDQIIFPYVTQKEKSTTSHSVPGPTPASGASKTHQQKCSSSLSTLNHTPSSSVDVGEGEDGDRLGDDDNHWLGNLGNIPSAPHHDSDGDANPDDVDVDDVPMVPDNRRRCSSLPLGPRPNVRPLSMSAETWRKRLGVEETEELAPDALPLSPVSDDSTEKASEAPTLSPDDSSSDEDEDYGQEIEVKVPLGEELVPSPGLLGPRPNARPMSMNGEKWKDRLTFSLWNNAMYEHEIVEESTDSSSVGSGENCTNRISSSSTISSSDWSFSGCSTASTASTAPSSIMEDVEGSQPVKQIRPLPSTPLQCEEETDDADDALASSPLTQDESDFVSSPDDEEDDDDFFVDGVSTPMTTPSVKLSFERNEKEHWETQAAHSREIETVFNDMLVNKYGVSPDPCAFLASAMEQVFGEGKAGRLCSMHLMLAPEEFRSYIEGETSSSEGKKEKRAAVRWSDELDKNGEKDKPKVFGTSNEKEVKEKYQRTRALTEPNSRNSNDSAASLGLPPGLSAKAAVRLGITYTTLANAAAESRSSSDSSSASSSSSSLASPLDNANRYKQSPGLLLWPSTLIPLSPAELEMHACKNMHDILGCKPALAEWVGGYVDDNGQRLVGDKEFEDAMWEYECFRRKRLNWPENLPEMSMDAGDGSASLITPATNIEIPTTCQRSNTLYPEKTMSDTSSTLTDATVTPTPPQALAGGMYAMEDLTHVRTIRVYEAVKSWRKRTSSPESDNNKTPTSASPSCSAA